MELSTSCDESNKSDVVYSENNGSKLCESTVDYAEHVNNKEEKKEVSSNIDEKDLELSRQIKEKSESLIHFIECISKSSTSYQLNKKHAFVDSHNSNDGRAITVKKPRSREIPLYRVVEYMKKARANKKHKMCRNTVEKDLKLSKLIKDKSESLIHHIESVIKPLPSSYLSV